ncbi:MAG: hypothetical protein QF479_07825 [Candidatus Poseidoniaceae archaeon]|jgi:NADH:ubiquinone oxidoreductase subunit|nr:hypothetical protein [Candidatus Poseidoniaceae archaeon]HJM87244.1 hypothetical protein [Candidatus Thalassarchaeaceae archaeon]|tara:strand:- start:137 stop:424 length:288 start_codon:yes stop_codon:yes gene_type:complete
MDGVDLVLWLIAATITFGLMIVAGWQIWIHHKLDERIAACDPALLSSVSHKVETSTDAPLGSVVVPYVPVQMVQTTPLQQPIKQQQLLSGKNIEN